MTGESREGSQSIDLSKVVGSPDVDAKVRINISRRPEATGPLKGLSGLCPEYRFQAKPKGGLPHTLESFIPLILNRPPALRPKEAILPAANSLCILLRRRPSAAAGCGRLLRTLAADASCGLLLRTPSAVSCCGWLLRPLTANAFCGLSLRQ